MIHYLMSSHRDHNYNVTSGHKNTTGPTPEDDKCVIVHVCSKVSEQLITVSRCR
jgi:hypothetical protein